jgi:enoyl-CoA hydratase
VTASRGAPLSWREAARCLADPAASERFSPLGGEPLLAVDFALAGAAEPAHAARALATLARLPCPTIALLAAGADAGLRDAFDVVLESPEPFAEIRARVAHAPLAAQALVQLLRAGRTLAVDDALVAESLAYSVLLAGPEFARWLASRRPVAAADPGDRPVIVEREGDTLRLTLNRPERRNAWGMALRDACAEALAVAAADPSVTAIEVRGAGPSFCAGGDLAEFGTFPDPATAHAVRSTRNVARLLAACTERVHVRVHGACVGAGAELPAFAARVTAAPDAWFQLPELAMGLVPGAGGTASLPRRIGRQRTAWLALSGRRIDAETALVWGLVDSIEGRK